MTAFDTRGFEPLGSENEQADLTRHMLRKRIHLVPDSSAKMTRSECVSVKEDALQLMEEWFNEFVWFSRHENAFALVDAIRGQLDSGDLVIADVDDVHALLFGFMIDMGLPSKTMEHYVNTGEFLDVLKLLDERADGMDTEDMALLCSKGLQRLYEHDVSSIQETAAGDDENRVVEVPLEIRAAFAGLYDREDIR